MFIPDKQSTEIARCQNCGKTFTYTRQTTIAGPLLPQLPPKYCTACKAKKIFSLFQK